MNIELSTGSRIAYLVVKSGDTTIKEDIANTNGKIDGKEQDDLIMAARDVSIFNRDTDVDFVEKVANMLLNDQEKFELIEKLQEALV